MEKLLDHSNQLTVSVRTEAILLHTDLGYYFVEYPTNKLPSTKNFKVSSKNLVTQLDEKSYISLKRAFQQFKDLHRTKPFLHAPSYLIGWCESEGLDCKILD